MTTNKMLKSGIKLLSETQGTGEPIKKGDTVKVRLFEWLAEPRPTDTRGLSWRG